MLPILYPPPPPSETLSFSAKKCYSNLRKCERSVGGNHGAAGETESGYSEHAAGAGGLHHRPAAGGHCRGVGADDQERYRGFKQAGGELRRADSLRAQPGLPAGAGGGRGFVGAEPYDGRFGAPALLQSAPGRQRANLLPDPQAFGGGLSLRDGGAGR